MTNVKLHINISQGIIDAEGDEEFVWRVYEDFRDRLGSAPIPASHSSVTEESLEEEGIGSSGAPVESKPKKRSSRKRQSNGQTSQPLAKEKSVGITRHRPRLLNDLDTTGLKDFLDQYKLANHTDTIVAMTKFLETKGITPANLDAFFTCYSDAGLKVPEAFGQAFVNARNRTAYIEYKTADDVVLTIRGRNHIDHGGIKKAEA